MGHNSLTSGVLKNKTVSIKKSVYPALSADENETLHNIARRLGVNEFWLALTDQGRGLLFFGYYKKSPFMRYFFASK